LERAGVVAAIFSISTNDVSCFSGLLIRSLDKLICPHVSVAPGIYRRRSIGICLHVLISMTVICVEL
jgi:hypothetical protein